MASMQALAKKEACKQVLYAVHVLHASETVIGGFRKKWYLILTKENCYLYNVVHRKGTNQCRQVSYRP
jgi:hypothetical protein